MLKLMLNLWFLCIAFCVGITCLSVFWQTHARKPLFHASRQILLILSFTVVLSITLFTFYSINYIRACTIYGLYTDDISAQDMMECMEKTPKEDDLPADLTNCIVIYYKFGCSDCEAVYGDLMAYLEDKPDVYFVSSRSRQGQKLLNLYPVDTVPTGVYITTKSTPEKPDYIQKDLTAADETGAIQLNTENLDRLFHFQETKR